MRIKLSKLRPSLNVLRTFVQSDGFSSQNHVLMLSLILATDAQEPPGSSQLHSEETAKEPLEVQKSEAITASCSVHSDTLPEAFAAPGPAPPLIYSPQKVAVAPQRTNSCAMIYF
ncbi:hypothetical protein FQA47_015081 [Oryzias melastigma]|uniref:Uncharacterized protein n=1 Tax=Oryzias melastigma TaxID=30732 RepID=A0A834FLZ5_ORYME|nr:hypothetical protein FQA47_015081 [Oryzias melastigma]